MKTARFSNVVKKCGKPEVYLLLSKEDPDFQKAVKANRLMTLAGGGRGAKAEAGFVGYDEKRRGQLLLFPKSLKPFADTRIVGIKYDLFSDHDPGEPALRKKKTSTQSVPRKAKASKLAKKSKPKPQPDKAEKSSAAKVIRFPQPHDTEDGDDESVATLKTYARQAMRALEKNNSVAAYNLLKRIAED
jgi:hypothetical protein